MLVVLLLVNQRARAHGYRKLMALLDKIPSRTECCGITNKVRKGTKKHPNTS